MPKREYQICTRCVMDTTDPDIFFDSSGVCNHCRETEPLFAKIRFSEEEAQRNLQAIADEIKSYGQGREYDSLMGLSGGVDSSYVGYLAKQMGLRPLVVHFDNGWDSELAVENIKKIVNRLEFDLYTYVINWEEFRDLQRSFFKASVIDIEILSDHAITAAMFNLAKEFKIKYILSGDNIATESGMPKAWVWSKQDLTNIKGIQKRFGTIELKSFPTFSTWQWLFNRISKRFDFIKLLNFINYRKTKAMEVLSSELGWRYYGGKHYESIFTKFYQAYVLPEKFGVDKRRAHLSSLIRNGEITREEALAELEKSLYDSEELRNDKEYVLKKLGFSESEFEEIMKLPIKSHAYYPTDEHIVRCLKPLGRVYRNFFG